MQTLSATPTEIGKLFDDKYTIPEYQRPYSWDDDECQQLWDDIESFFSIKGKSEKYFCGCIIFCNDADGKTVIDGQQRLTTFLLLLKALLEKAGTHSRLENCVRIKDDVSGDLTSEIKIKSNVIGNDRAFLSKIIIDGTINPEQKKYNRFEKNFYVFASAIDNWRKGKTVQEFNEFIKGILDDIVLLPIECSSQDDALTIFNTVNNRGMSLCDADIFKAILYKSTVATVDKEIFLSEWDKFKRDDIKENYDWLFNAYMHIIMALDGTIVDTRERVNKRKFFDRKKNLQRDPKEAMDALKKIDAIWDAEISDTTYALWNIMRQYPNDLWYYPLYVYLFKHATINTDGELVLDTAKNDEYEKLFVCIVKYCILKGIVYNTSNAIKHTIYKICKDIALDENFFSEFVITDDENTEFVRKVNASNLARFSRCTILLAAFLNPKQDTKAFNNLFSKKWDIEHILPKKGWNNYSGWTEKEYEASLGLIGNLVPFNKVLNILAKNDFFDKKKVEYAKEEDVQDVKDLTNIPQWEPGELNERNTFKVKLILDYFRY